jgi:hypothetical protein
MSDILSSFIIQFLSPLYKWIRGIYRKNDIIRITKNITVTDTCLIIEGKEKLGIKEPEELEFVGHSKIIEITLTKAQSFYDTYIKLSYDTDRKMWWWPVKIDHPFIPSKNRLFSRIKIDIDYDDFFGQRKFGYIWLSKKESAWIIEKFYELCNLLR